MLNKQLLFCSPRGSLRAHLRPVMKLHHHFDVQRSALYDACCRPCDVDYLNLMKTCITRCRAVWLKTCSVIPNIDHHSSDATSLWLKICAYLTLRYISGDQITSGDTCAALKYDWGIRVLFHIDWGGIALLH